MLGFKLTHVSQRGPLSLWSTKDGRYEIEKNHDNVINFQDSTDGNVHQLKD